MTQKTFRAALAATLIGAAALGAGITTASAAGHGPGYNGPNAVFKPTPGRSGDWRISDFHPRKAFPPAVQKICGPAVGKMGTAWLCRYERIYPTYGRAHHW